MKYYRKKPVEVEAMRLIGDAPETFKVCNWMVENDYPWLLGNALKPEKLYDCRKPSERPDKGIWIRPEDGSLMIRTLEGDMEAPYGWWIIKGVKGEFYSCRDDIFRETYEGIEDGWEETLKYNEAVRAAAREATLARWKAQG